MKEERGKTKEESRKMRGTRSDFDRRCALILTEDAFIISGKSPFFQHRGHGFINGQGEVFGTDFRQRNPDGLLGFGE